MKPKNIPIEMIFVTDLDEYGKVFEIFLSEYNLKIEISADVDNLIKRSEYRRTPHSESEEILARKKYQIHSCGFYGKRIDENDMPIEILDRIIEMSEYESVKNWLDEKDKSLHEDRLFLQKLEKEKIDENAHQCGLNEHEWENVTCKRAARSLARIIKRHNFQIKSVTLARTGTIYIDLNTHQDDLIKIRLADHPCYAGAYSHDGRTENYTIPDIDIRKNMNIAQIEEEIDDYLHQIKQSEDDLELSFSS